MRSILPIIACLCMAGTTLAQKKDSKPEYQPPPGNVNIIVDMIAVSRAEAFTLVRQDSAAMWAKVSEMVKTGTATSEYLASATTLPGERCIIECILEFRYPTEFEPPEVPPKEEPTAAPAAEGNPPPPQGEIAKLLQSQITPTAFDVRNVGAMMEALPQMSEKGIQLELIPGRTLLDSFTAYPLGLEKSLLRADQPLFQTYKTQTKVLLESGKPMFLAAGDMAPTRDVKIVDKVMLFFVTATFEPVK